MAAPLVEIGQGPGRWPGWGMAMMYLIFGGIAAMGIAATAPLVLETPTLILAWLGMLFPVAVVYTVGRLIQRHAVRLWPGEIEVVQPFKTTRLRLADVSRIHRRTVLQGGSGLVMRWLDFGGADGRALLNLSANPFSNAELDRFAAALLTEKPEIVFSTD